MRDLYGRRIFFTFDKLRYELHGPRTVECDERDDFVEGAQADLSAELLHPAGLQLKDACSATRVEKIEGLFVIKPYICDVKIGTVAGDLNVLLCVEDHGQSLQPQEVHFE